MRRSEYVRPKRRLRRFALRRKRPKRRPCKRVSTLALCLWSALSPMRRRASCARRQIACPRLSRTRDGARLWRRLPRSVIGDLRSKNLPLVRRNSPPDPSYGAKRCERDRITPQTPDHQMPRCGGGVSTPPKTKRHPLGGGVWTPQELATLIRGGEGGGLQMSPPPAERSPPSQGLK